MRVQEGAVDAYLALDEYLEILRNAVEDLLFQVEEAAESLDPVDFDIALGELSEAVERIKKAHQAVLHCVGV